MSTIQILAGIAGILGFTVALIALWTNIRNRRQTAKTAFEQKRQTILNLFYESQLTTQKHLEQLTDLLLELPRNEVQLRERTLALKSGREMIGDDLQQLQDKVHQLTANADQEVASGLEILIGYGNKYKTITSSAGPYIDKYVSNVHKLIALQAALEAKTMELEEATKKRKELEKELRELEKELRELHKPDSDPEVGET